MMSFISIVKISYQGGSPSGAGVIRVRSGFSHDLRHCRNSFGTGMSLLTGCRQKWVGVEVWRR
jgi:hypothetical protein